jgi:hypothetical protein
LRECGNHLKAMWFLFSGQWYGGLIEGGARSEMSRAHQQKPRPGLLAGNTSICAVGPEAAGRRCVTILGKGTPYPVARTVSLIPCGIASEGSTPGVRLI